MGQNKFLVVGVFFLVVFSPLHITQARKLKLTQNPLPNKPPSVYKLLEEPRKPSSEATSASASSASPPSPPPISLPSTSQTNDFEPQDPGQSPGFGNQN
ncbi:hypothetical protein ACJRO7_034474 [Eucalyptus globulus]|uniref:Uncharacterized protein n=1 Tax=Eucalyptus globulus TaxID=34317 RepID=A0ABD3J6C8_EUCGL